MLTVQFTQVVTIFESGPYGRPKKYKIKQDLDFDVLPTEGSLVLLPGFRTPIKCPPVTLTPNENHAAVCEIVHTPEVIIQGDWKDGFTDYLKRRGWKMDPHKDFGPENVTEQEYYDAVYYDRVFRGKSLGKPVD